jgi:hypothetical protein
MKRRLGLVPFDFRICEKDGAPPDKLRAAAAGMLFKLIREETEGCGVKINAKPGVAIVPVRAESCGECVFYNGAYCEIHFSNRECSDFEDQFGGYVFKAVAVADCGGRA